MTHQHTASGDQTGKTELFEWAQLARGRVKHYSANTTCGGVPV